MWMCYNQRVKSQPKIIKFLKQSFVLALASALGYTIAFFYGQGYLGYFGIPAQFVDLELPSIISAVIISIGFTFMLFANLDDLFSDLESGHHLERFIFLMLLMHILIVSILREFNIFILLSVLFFFGVWIALWMAYHKNKNVNKLYNFLTRKGGNSFFENFFGVRYDSIVVFTLFIASLTYFFTSVGYFMARITTEYKYITLANQTYAVIGYKNDNILLMPLITKEKKITKKLYVYPINSLTPDKSPLILTEIKDVEVEK